jgi:hypothetical protein
MFKFASRLQGIGVSNVEDIPCPGEEAQIFEHAVRGFHIYDAMETASESTDGVFYGRILTHRGYMMFRLVCEEVLLEKGLKLW